MFRQTTHYTTNNSLHRPGLANNQWDIEFPLMAPWMFLSLAASCGDQLRRITVHHIYVVMCYDDAAHNQGKTRHAAKRGSLIINPVGMVGFPQTATPRRFPTTPEPTAVTVPGL